MATTQKRDATWINIDIATLSADQQAAYKSYKDAYALMKAEREAFEALISAAVNPPAGKRVVFGYNFGKLSLAIVDDDTKPAKPSSAVSLSDLVRR